VLVLAFFLYRKKLFEKSHQQGQQGQGHQRASHADNKHRQSE
jgi:hypothetical protein